MTDKTPKTYTVTLSDPDRSPTLKQKYRNTHLLNNVPNTPENREFWAAVAKEARASGSIVRSVRLRGRGPRDGSSDSNQRGVSLEKATHFAVYLQTLPKSRRPGPSAWEKGYAAGQAVTESLAGTDQDLRDEVDRLGRELVLARIRASKAQRAADEAVAHRDEAVAVADKNVKRALLQAEAYREENEILRAKMKASADAARAAWVASNRDVVVDAAINAAHEAVDETRALEFLIDSLGIREEWIDEQMRDDAAAAFAVG